MTLRNACILALALVASCKKKAPEPVGPIVGWHTDEGAMGACYHPPDFSEMGMGDLRQARSEALSAMMTQWTGQRDDGISFDETVATGVETVLLGYPEKVDGVVLTNLQHCKTAMAGGGTSAWDAWLRSLPGKLTAGECLHPLDLALNWYVDIGMGWQGYADVCEGEPVEITASSMDYYRVDDKGPWINAAGDPDKPASGADYLCTLEGCLAGQLVLRFRGASGAEVITPIGLGTVFTPPEHGIIEFSINDTSYFNNVWKTERGVQHRTSVIYAPVD